MGSAKEQALIMDETSTEVAIQAGAVSPCPAHDEVLMNQYDDDANKKAYAIGTNLWKEGGIPCDRAEFMAAIKEVIDTSADECGACAKLMAE